MGFEVTLPGANGPTDGRAGVEAWVLATLPRALAFAGSLLRDRALSEDVVRDCYVRLLRKAGTYDLPRDGTKILFKAITHACIDRNYRDRTLLSLDVEADPRSIGPDDLAAHRELEEAVAAELAALSVAQRGP